MIIKSEEILGVQEGERLLCHECAKIEGVELDDPDVLFLSKEVEESDDLFFCDNCKKKLEAA